MNVIQKDVLEQIKQNHSDIREQLNAWLTEAESAHWKTPHDIKKKYRSASFLSNNIVIFNIKGNHYRLAVQVNYSLEIVFIKKIGAHTEYSKWKF